MQMAADKVSQLDSAKERPLTSVNKKILILSTARSGSTLFCEQLASAGCFGDPQEWLNPMLVDAYKEVHGQVSIGNYIGNVIRKSSGENGVFSINVHVRDYKEYLDSGINLLDLNFEHIVYLYRKDKVAQSVSRAKAAATGEWRSEARALHDVSGPPSKPQIACGLAMLLEEEDYYSEYLQQHSQMSFAYEDFTGVNKERVFCDMLSLIGEDEKVYSFPETGMRIQRTNETVRAGADFLHYLSGGW